MSLGPPDLHPNLLVISTEPAPALDPAPAPDPSIISKNSEENFDFYPENVNPSPPPVTLQFCVIPRQIAVCAPTAISRLNAVRKSHGRCMYMSRM